MSKRSKAPYRVAVCLDSSKSLGQAAFLGVAEYVGEANCQWILQGQSGKRLWLPGEIAGMSPDELDGVIGMSSNEAVVARFRSAGVCWVSVFGEPADPAVPAVFSDNVAMGRLAARHLAELGLKTFVYYGSDLVSSSEARFKGFAKYLAKHRGGGEELAVGTDRLGQAQLPSEAVRAVRHPSPAGPAAPPYHPPGRSGRAVTAAVSNITCPIHIKMSEADLLLSSSDERRDYLRRLGGELLRVSGDGQEAIGVFACSDSMGLTVIDACREVGLAVPEKVAVLGVASDEIICELAVPPLTTIQQDARQVGRRAAALLDGQLGGRLRGRRRVVVPPLGIKVRRSTDLFATSDPYVVKALQFIRERFRGEIRIEELLRLLKISRRPFEKRFRLAMGRSPYGEVVRLRVRCAESLLVQTDEPVPVVAQKAGFGSERQFFQSFKQMTGLSPVQYRKRKGRGI